MTEIVHITEREIEDNIVTVRGRRVMLDFLLAQLYGVENRTLLQSVKRHSERFPGDFMFQLTDDEFALLRSQNVISKVSGRGGRRYRPYVFTEQGVAMLSSVLNSPRAIQVNIEIMRAFVRLRQIVTANAELMRRFDTLEKKYDAQFKMVFDAIRQLMQPPERKRRSLGFARPDSEDE